MTTNAQPADYGTTGLRPHRFARFWRRPPLTAHLAAFALLVMIPALLFSAFLIARFSQHEAEIAAARVAAAAETLSGSIDRELATMIATASVIAASPAFEPGELADFESRGSAVLAVTPFAGRLVDPSLRIVADTGRDAKQAPVAAADTAAEAAVFRTRQPAVSDVAFEAGADVLRFRVAVPVIRGDRVLYAFALSRDARDLGAFVADGSLPETWSAMVVDRQRHRVAAALSAGGRVRENHHGVPFENPSIAATLGIDAGDVFQASHTSALSGWTTTVAVPEAVIGQPIMRSWRLLAFAGLALVAFSVAMAMFFGRRLIAPIRMLAAQANAIGKGKPAQPVRTDIAEIGDVSRVLLQASRERREAEEQTRFLMREMTHRAKNQYALIAAIARRAAKESTTTAEFLDTLSEALASLARSADLLASRGWESVGLKELILAQLKAFGADENGAQFETAGPPVQLNPGAAQTIGLALHELATNAAKYGALSVPDGTVRIEWSLGERFALSWREFDGPAVSPPKRSGFGTLVVQKMTARGLGGAVDMDFAPAGVFWRLECPPDAVAVH